MSPSELRMLANQWRNVAGVSSTMQQAMRDLGALGMHRAQIIVDNAIKMAQSLEDQADLLELGAPRKVN